MPWLGVLGLFVWVFGPFTIRRAITLRDRLAHTGEPGDGRVTAGLVLGIIGTVFLVLRLVFYVILSVRGY
ncbi:hypothetical protein [Cellulomonas soli]